MRSAALILILLPVPFLCSPEKYDFGELVQETCTQHFPGRPCQTEGWFRLNNEKCIKLFKTENFIGDAEMDCLEAGGHLLSMHNLDEYNEATCLLWRDHKDGPKPVWIGLGKDWGSTSYEYTDGTKLDFNRWLPTSARNTAKQAVVCVQMNYDTWGRWSEKDCAAKLPYICATNM